MDAQTAQSLLEFVVGIAPGLRGDDSKTLFEQLERRYPDLLSAMDWFITHERADEAFCLASPLVVFWMATKRLEEGSALLDRALALPGGSGAHRARALFDEGYLAFWQGDYERSASLQNQALALGREARDPTVQALALGGLARIALRTDVEEARRLCREAIAVTEGTDDRLGRSGAMHVLGVAAQMAGDFAEARDVMSQRIAIAREQGNLAVISYESGNLSMVERQLGNLDEAERLALEALDIAYRRGDELAVPWMVNGVAAVAADRGEFQRAAALLGFADAAMEAAGSAWPPDERIHYDRTIALATEALDPAEFEWSRAAGRAMTAPEAVEFALGARTSTQPG